MDFMVSKMEEKTNPTFLGIPLDKIISLIQTLGIPTLFMLFVCFMIYRYVPTIVEGHVELLKRTGDTLEKMDETLKQTNTLMSEVAAVERETKVFMQNVNAAHETVQKDITVIKETVTKNGNK